MNNFRDNFDIKMIGLDLDGTTLKYGDVFSERTLEAFRRAKEKGVHIVIATGRTRKSLPPMLFDIPQVEFVITSNGAHITRLSDMKVIYEDIISPKAVESVVKNTEKLGYVMEAFIDGAAYIDSRTYNLMEQNPHDFQYRDVDYVLDTRIPVEDVYKYTLNHSHNIENISITFPYEEDRRKLVNLFGGIDGITLTSSFPHNIEIGGKTTSKAQALAHLLTIFNLTRDNLMACGDSPNDGKMIELAAIGVAMENSHPYILDIADHVTDSCYDDGVAKAIERFVL